MCPAAADDALLQLRRAVALLHHPQSNRDEKHAADEHLSRYQRSAGAAAAPLYATLLETGDRSERFFAAASLRQLATKDKALVQQESLAPLCLRLSALGLRAAAAGEAATCNQLIGSLALLAVRAPGWEEARLVPDLLSLLGSHPLVSLRALAALPEACTSPGAQMHPARRRSVAAALAGSQEVAALAAAAMGAGPACETAALQLVLAWCSCLGAVPAGLCSQHGFLASLCQAAAGEGCSLPAEALAALLGCASADLQQQGEQQEEEQQGEQQRQRREEARHLLGLLLQRLEPTLAALSAAAAQAPPERARELLFGAATVLCAAGRALEALARAGGAAELAAPVGECAVAAALALLQHPDAAVSLAGLEFWSDRLESGALAGGGALAMQLCAALLQRAAFPPGIGAAVTADGRDAPMELRELRKEVADAFRAAAEAAGALEVIGLVGQAATEALAHWRAAGEPAEAWMRAEACLYALNLVLPKHWGLLDAQAVGHTAELCLEFMTSPQLAACPKLAGTLVVLLGGIGSQLLAAASHAEGVHPGRGGGGGGGSPLPATLVAVLDSLLGLLAQPDDKLARCAATCVHRLSGSSHIRGFLLAHSPTWPQRLLRVYAGQGRQPSAEGGELSAPDYCLRALCELRLERELLQLHVGQASLLLGSACGPAEAEAAAHHLGCLSVALEQRGSALDAEALAAVGELLHQASRTGSPALLLQAACRAAVAVPEPGMAWALLESMCAPAPAHPAVLAALRELLPAVGQGAVGHGAALAAVSASLTTACSSHRLDPDWQESALQLAAACAADLPAALDAAALAQLLPLAQAAAGSSHRGACEALATYCQSACSAAREGSASEEVRLLAQRMGGGGGAPPLVAALLHAASGGQPSFMIATIAEALYSTWLAVGTERFGAWLQAAVIDAPLAGSPWCGWQSAVVAATLADLLSDRSRHDVARFKKLLKTLCGGKKKGQVALQPARGA